VEIQVVLPINHLTIVEIQVAPLLNHLAGQVAPLADLLIIVGEVAQAVLLVDHLVEVQAAVLEDLLAVAQVVQEVKIAVEAVADR
jgi:hypothetical protein